MAAVHQKAFFAFQFDEPPQGYCDFAETTTTSLLGLYVAYHVLAHCQLLFRENFKMNPASRDSLFDFFFNHRYQQLVEQILECIKAKQPTALGSIKTNVLPWVTENHLCRKKIII